MVKLNKNQLKLDKKKLKSTRLIRQLHGKEFTTLIFIN
jgi:hypothetical protein